jgi:hypothetical protein
MAILVLTVILEAVFYPEVASWISRTIGNGATPDSSMGYFWDVYIIPSAVAFAGIVMIATPWSVKRSHRALHMTLTSLLLVNVLGLIFSALWYFRVTEAAAGATTR